jgi:TPR repeat protein
MTGFSSIYSILPTVIVAASPVPTPKDSYRAKLLLKKANKFKKKADDEKNPTKRKEYLEEAKENYRAVFDAIEGGASFRINKGVLAQSCLSYAECLFWTEGELEASLKKSLQYFDKAIANINDLKKFRTAEAYAERGMVRIKLASKIEKTKPAEAQKLYNDAAADLKKSLEYIRMEGYHHAYDEVPRAQQIYYTLGWVTQYKLKTPNLKEAEKYYNLALAEYKSNGLAPHVILGKIYVGLAQVQDFHYKNKTEALRLYNLALSNPSNLKKEDIADVKLRIGEIRAIEILDTMDDSPGRNAKLEELVVKYFKPAGNSKAKLWIARIHAIGAGQDAGKLEEAKTYLVGILPSLDAEDIPEARLILGELLFRIEVLNPGKKDFSEVLKHLDFAIANAPDNNTKAKAYLLKAKILIIEKDYSGAETLLNTAGALSDVEPYVQGEIIALSKTIPGILKFLEAEKYRYGDGVKEDHVRAIKLYEEAIKILKPLDNYEGKIYLAQAYLYVGELYRYGENIRYYLLSSRNYEEAINVITREKMSGPTALYILVVAQVGLADAKIDFFKQGDVLEDTYNEARDLYMKALLNLNKWRAVDPSNEEIPVLEARIYVGLARLYDNEDWSGYDPGRATGYLKRARAILKETDHPSAKYVRRSMNNALGNRNKVEMTYTNKTVEKKLTITNDAGEEDKFLLKAGKRGDFTVGGLFADYDFERTPTMGHFTNDYVTSWDTNGDPLTINHQTMDREMLETKSTRRLRLDLSYAKNIDWCTFWATLGIENIETEYTTYTYSWQHQPAKP